MILILVFGLGGSVLAMEKDIIKLATSDGQEVEISYDMALKIPMIKGITEEFSGFLQKDVIPVHVKQQTLLSILGFIDQVYTQAPVLKLDPQFFEQTDKHPAYTASDIPAQVRSMITEQGLQNDKKFIQAAKYLLIDWIDIALQDRFSIADLVVLNQISQFIKPTRFNLPGLMELDLYNRNITSLAGAYLIPMRDKIVGLYLHNNYITQIPGNAFSGFTGLIQLILFDNQIKFVDEQAFKGMNQNLFKLDLSDNRLVSVPVIPMGLKELWLQNNRIDYISNADISKLMNLQVLNLRGNPLDQEMLNLLQNMKDKAPGVSIDVIGEDEDDYQSDED